MIVTTQRRAQIKQETTNTGYSRRLYLSPQTCGAGSADAIGATGTTGVRRITESFPG